MKKVTSSANIVMATKILKSGKLGASRNFKSVNDAARKVAPNSNSATAAANIRHAIRGERPTAYGYVWN